jgi:hypothetical protein
MSTTGPPVTGLVALPEELILATLDQINHNDLSTIHALNTTCRLLHHLTVDRLYRTYSGRAPQQFLRTIALPPPDGKPAFASHVKKVVWYQSYWTHQARKRGLSLSDRHLVAGKLRNSGCILNTMDLSMDLPGRFIGFSEEYEVHWWYLEFFLFFTPKVEELLVYDAWQWDDHSYWFESLAANPTYFDKMKWVTLHGPLRLENIVPLLTLPSIRNLELTEVVNMRQEAGRTFQWSNSRDEYMERRLAYGSSLERLVLRKSDLCFPPAIELFQKLRNLKSFTYEHDDNYLTYPGGRGTYVFQALGEIHGKDSSLEHLRLREQRVLAVGEVPLLFGWITSSDEVVPTLEKLRVLDVGPCDLKSFIGTDDESIPVSKVVERLPRTLETLHIQWAYCSDCQHQLPQFLDFLLVLAQTSASANLNLKRVAIVEWPALAGWFPLLEEKSSLERAFEEMGMQFVVLYGEVKSQEPLEVLDDVEPEWLWVHKTSSFGTRSAFLFAE